MSEAVSAGLAVSVFESVIEVGDAEARMALARQLVALISDPQTPAIEIRQVGPVLQKLSLDKDKEVRVVLAEELATSSRIDADLAFCMISDDDDIALPFLAQTRALSAEQMLVVVKVGDIARQVVVAARPDISVTIAANIIASCGADAVLALLDNPVIQFEGCDYQALHKRLGNVPEVSERLLTMPDLPLDIRITQARRAALRMRKLVAQKGWLASGESAELCTDAEDSAVMQILIDASPLERAGALRFMSEKNLLTPAFIVRAAATGQMSVVEAALGHLAGFEQSRAAAQMYVGGTANFKSMFRRSGLPQSCYGLLRAACDVVIEMREEGSDISSSEFGGRLLEALMTRYEDMAAPDRARQIEFLGRYADKNLRHVARRLKADLLRAA